MSSQRYRNICFTLNNYTEDEIQVLEAADVQYMIYGKEVAPTTGTPHLQGYVELKTQQRIKGVKKLLGTDRMYIEERMGTQQQAIDYCKKSGDYYERGQIKVQGNRKDIDNVVKAVKSGMTKEEVLNQFPSEAKKYMRFIDSLYQYEPARTVEQQNEGVEVYWLWGPTGTGKTKYVYDNEERDQIFTPLSFKWWNGYDRQKVVLIDDMRADFCKFHELLKLLDRYPYKVEVKGGMRQLVANKIYITAPYEPQTMYKGKTDEDLEQLLRRIKEVRYIGPTHKGKPVKRIKKVVNSNPTTIAAFGKTTKYIINEDGNEWIDPDTTDTDSNYSEDSL